MGKVIVKFFGSKEDILKIKDVLLKHYKNPWVSGPFENYRDRSQGSHRLYVNLEIKEEAK